MNKPSWVPTGIIEYVAPVSRPADGCKVYGECHIIRMVPLLPSMPRDESLMSPVIGVSPGRYPPSIACLTMRFSHSMEG